MAAATRKPPAGQSAAPGTDVMLTTLIRIVNRMIVNASYGPGPATFRYIATTQLHVATDAEVDTIEAWMSARQ